MSNNSTDTQIKILKDAEAIKFMFNNMDAINSKFGPYDKNKFFYNTGEKSWGKLPDEARKIIMLTKAPINIKDVQAYLKDGTRGVIIAVKDYEKAIKEGYETPEITVLHFDLSSNTFALLENFMNKLMNDDKLQKTMHSIIHEKYGISENDPEADEKLQNLMSGMMERIGETEPEIREWIAGGIG